MSLQQPSHLIAVVCQVTREHHLYLSFRGCQLSRGMLMHLLPQLKFSDKYSLLSDCNSIMNIEIFIIQIEIMIT